MLQLYASNCSSNQSKFLRKKKLLDTIPLVRKTDFTAINWEKIGIKGSNGLSMRGTYYQHPHGLVRREIGYQPSDQGFKVVILKK